ncbi:MAG: response regulator [Ferruginibacter sp.]
MQVLIVDNSLLIIHRLEELLSETANISRMYRAAFYKEALELFMLNKPDIVVLDIGLPQNASYQLLKEIKKANPETVVIILSIHIDEYTQQQCSILGADFFFDKYHEYEKISEVINFFHNKKLVS